MIGLIVILVFLFFFFLVKKDLHSDNRIISLYFFKRFLIIILLFLLVATALTGISYLVGIKDPKELLNKKDNDIETKIDVEEVEINQNYKYDEEINTNASNIKTYHNEGNYSSTNTNKQTTVADNKEVKKSESTQSTTTSQTANIDTKKEEKATIKEQETTHEEYVYIETPKEEETPVIEVPKQEEKTIVVEEPKQEKTIVVEEPKQEKTIVVEEPKKEEKTKTLSKKDNAIYFLNVGASTDSFILYDNGHYGLIDTSLSKNGDKIVKDLKKLGVKKLDFILITHSHNDHTGGYEKVMKNIPVKTLYIKVDGTKYPSHQKSYKKIINTAKNKKTSICDIKKKKCQKITLGNTKIKLYNTEFFSSKGISLIHKGRFENVNSVGAVATINGKRIYFAGDIGNYFGYNQESKTAKKVGDVDVYKAAHHGYYSFNNHQDALNKLKPEYTIITNTRKQATTTVSRLKKANKNYKKTYYTVDGTVVLKVTEKGKLKFKQ